MADLPSTPKGFIAGVVHRFLTSQLSIIMIILSLCLGVAAILVTPREEDPQIVVPLADIYVSAPGASAEEVEKLVATPLERLLWQIDGVEYVYSMSHQDMAVVTVRFYVGEERENSILKVHNRIAMYQDEAPPIVRGWVVKPIEIDDVPIVNLTLFSDRYDDHELRRMARRSPGTALRGQGYLADTDRRRQKPGSSRGAAARTHGRPGRLPARGAPGADGRRCVCDGGHLFTGQPQSTTVTANAFLTSAGEVGGLVVGVHEGRPVYLRDVASIVDGPREADTYSRIGYAHYYRSQNGLEETPRSYPAVTLALAKKKGTNAVTVAANILDELETLKKEVPGRRVGGDHPQHRGYGPAEGQ
jgi:multidrug efflux pump subunit AcrB